MASKETAIEYARKGGSILLVIGAGVAIIKSNPWLAAGEILGAWLLWPKEKKGAGAHMTQSTGINRVFESASSLFRINKAEAALHKKAA